MKIWAPVREHYHRHPYGSCRVITEQDRDWVFVNIPKNASSWMIRAFGRGREANYLDTAQRPRHYIVVLRDPVDRWISGFAQVQVGTTPWHSSHYQQRGWDSIFNQVIFDNHTEPQVSFLQGLDTEQITWLRFGADLARDVAAWSRCHIELDLQPLARGEDNEYNLSEYSSAPVFRNPRYPYEEIPGPTMWDIQAQTHDAIESNPRYRDALEYVYRQDHTLYETVDFYRKDVQ